jgi:predicted GH43/DUF377 family glycosyl hydrolase
MLTRRLNRCLLRPEDLAPTSPELRVVGAFNPGAVEVDGRVVLLVRVAEAAAEDRCGFVGLPRWVDGRVVIDWVADHELRRVDPRVVETVEDGLTRLTFTSHLRVVHLTDDLEVDHDALARCPRFDPAGDGEAFGVEDPRISRIDEEIYFTFVAVSRHGACTALASTRDFVSFRRHGVIFPPENKDVLLFAGRIDGRYAALHRPNPRTHFDRPQMWLARSHDLIHWGCHEPVADRAGNSEATETWKLGRVGGGCPPVELADGWLEIYHGNQRVTSGPGPGVGTYCAAALLLDRDDPSRVVRRSDAPIMAPQTAFEREGFVPDVVFPTGVIDRGDTLLVFYGAADTVAGVVAWSKQELLDTMS